MRARLGLAFLLLICLPFAASARVISYAPYTDRAAIPATQSRTNRHFALIEQIGSINQFVPPPIGTPPPGYYFPPAQLVLYDSKGEEEPRVIFPQDGTTAPIVAAAVREGAQQQSSILIETSADFEGANPNHEFIWLLSADGGSSWKKAALPAGPFDSSVGADTGGRFVHARYGNIRIGTDAVPFAVAIGPTVYGVHADGSASNLMNAPPNITAARLVGSNHDGSRFIVNTNAGMFIVNGDGSGSSRLTTAQLVGQVEGWITPSGDALLESTQNPGLVVLYRAQNGMIAPVDASWDGPANAQPPINSSWVYFAVPTSDYSGAWIIKRGGGRPTTLSRYVFSPSGTSPVPDLQPEWSDVSAPEVEALIPSASGERVLIQVHRPRQTVDNLMFKDPALAVWHAGDPAPKNYDELFLSETPSKAFVHVDVDHIGSGDPFVFDSGVAQLGGGGTIISPAPPSGGGSDVVQEWGVVRASLAQRLVVPGVGRTRGAYDSDWATDFTLYNPSDAPLGVTLSFVQNGAGSNSAASAVERQVTLVPREIRTIPDILMSLFGLADGNGAVYVTPDAGGALNVTSRTYNKTAGGTYGFTVNGIDVFTAAGPRFPLTFSGAFQGPNYRTNVFLADLSGKAASVSAMASGPYGALSDDPATFAGAQQMQINSIAPAVGAAPSAIGALTLRPNSGQMIASVFVVDNRTNDPTFFPADIPASVMRTIPAIGHLDGANGSKFRTDLYLFNDSDTPKTLALQAKLWDVPENPSSISLTLLAHEARMIPDALQTVFGKSGIARLRFTTQGSSIDPSVRVTSRTYTVDAGGGTYGFQMPPLNSFQSAGAGDTLEILGASLDPAFRTNLGLVDLTAWPGPRAARARVEVVGDRGQPIDSFEIAVPSAGGLQIIDLFHGRGLPESDRPVLLRISAIEGMIGAYAAIVDNGTNDPAYVAANLASH